MFKVNNKYNQHDVINVVLVIFIVGIFIVDFEQVNVYWAFLSCSLFLGLFQTVVLHLDPKKI